ncbi:hypothetical protein EVAR_46958_1 [Eumeta japonica]|uniref:Uncharacterized protein n=1 Tax=Eumeta variegata TaxID=151549 RepID=A0A4C1YLW6_EUMVA|nr:hypothetical protein EVAR_46958_1 [Eumeta japonica]
MTGRPISTVLGVSRDVERVIRTVTGYSGIRHRDILNDSSKNDKVYVVKGKIPLNMVTVKHSRIIVFPVVTLRVREVGPRRPAGKRQLDYMSSPTPLKPNHFAEHGIQ